MAEPEKKKDAAAGGAAQPAPAANAGVQNASTQDDDASLNDKGKIPNDVKTILSNMAQTAPPNSVFNIIFAYDAKGPIIAGVAGNVNNNGPTATKNAEEAVAITIESLCATRDAAFLASAVFLPDVSVDFVVRASQRLEDAIDPDAKTEKANPFAASRRARIERIQGEIKKVDDRDAPSGKVEVIAFRGPAFAQEARQHLWVEATDLRRYLTPWLTELVDGEGDLIALRVAIAVADCAAADIDGIYAQLLEPWLLSDSASARLAAGQVLGLSSDPAANQATVQTLRRWSLPNASGAQRRGAGSLCQSAWGVRNAEEALTALKRLVSTGRRNDFRHVQRAIDTFWGGASLFPDSYGTLGTLVLRALASWFTPDRQSVLSFAPPVHLALACTAERTSIERSGRALLPLAFRLVDTDIEAADVCARLFQNGLRNPTSRGSVQTLLDGWAERSATDADWAEKYSAFLRLVRSSGDEDDFARLSHYAERWRAKFNLSVAFVAQPS